MPEKETPFVLSLEATVFTQEQLRPWTQESELVQIALAGRSNVGKSSLINALARRRQLAKTSATPGKTRSINFYKVSPHNFILTDLPGYGYARCSQEERQKWAKLIEIYLETSQNLKAVVLLLDCRLPPQDSDRNLADFVRNKNLLPVLTKIDKCSKSEQNRRIQEWANLLDGVKPLGVSAEKRIGVETLRQKLIDMLAQS